MKTNFTRALALCSLALSIVCASARASQELDRLYRLSSIGVLKPHDNMDGLFSELMTETFKTAIEHDSRFQYQDLKQANSVLSKSKIPYHQVIEDADVLSKVAAQYQLDTFVRSKVFKEGPRYRFTIEWIFAKDLQVLSSDTFLVDDPFKQDSGDAGKEVFKREVSNGWERVLKKLPFQGAVTGRDSKAVTLNIGKSSGLKKNDTVVIGTLEEVKVHPLLKRIVDWRFASTAKVKVTEVEDSMAFAEIDVEDYGRQAGRFQKILQVIPAPPEVEHYPTQVTDRDAREAAAKKTPEFGYLAPGLWIGNLSREASNATGTAGFEGSASAFGFRGEGQVWLTPQWFAELQLNYAIGSYTQKNIATKVETAAKDVSYKFSQFKLLGGYFLHFSPDFFGPKAMARLGYQSAKFSLPNSATESTSTVDYSGLTVGVGGDLPFREAFGGELSIDFGVITSGTEAGGYYGTNSGATLVDFRLGGYYWFEPKIKLLFSVDVKSYSLDFASGSTISNKVLSFGPQVNFYF